MGRPRFLLVTGHRTIASSAAAVGLSTWAGAPSPDGAWVSWRFVGANNRELARSCHVFATTADCLSALARVRDQAEPAEALVAMDQETGLWGWRFDLSDRRVAVSARSYQRRREAHYGLNQFLAAVADPATAQDSVIRPNRAGLRPIRLAHPLPEAFGGLAREADPS